MVLFTVCNCLTRVEADGMDEEQATTGALETYQSERRQRRSRRMRRGLICQVARRHLKNSVGQLGAGLDSEFSQQ
jgi:hypothetical protein